ncbi:MAG: type II/IV secretion system protein [Phycisphaeraceae bacterium]|nr:type II/IV secretion system protein [Phycisphaeraceae bacterium]
MTPTPTTPTTPTPPTSPASSAATIEPPPAVSPNGGALGAPSGVLDARPSAEFLAHVSHEFARRHLVLSAGVEDGAETLLVAEGARPTATLNVGVRLGRPVRTRAVPAEALAAAIDRVYAQAHDGERVDAPEQHLVLDAPDDPGGELDAALRAAESDLLSTQGKAPAVRLVDLVLFEALLRDASDVHVQPLRDRTLVRYRLDGALHTVRELPAALAAAVVTRIKVIARLDVAERRAPQDGRATVTVGGAAAEHAGRRVDLRVSTLPSTYGERVVLRLLDPARSPHLSSFAALGMPPHVERAYLAQAGRANGVVLSTGPTGSGKTTTLYATLAWINASRSAAGAARGCELNIMTVEDPVEYDLAAGGMSVSQTQVDPRKGLTFAAGLRHILRQDPDVVMVGEVRDEETARTAVQASLTGHLVLSTLHTNDAASAVARLLDLGIEPFLVASSLSAVLAQRLVRTLHAGCGGNGCDACLGTGFKGRTGVFELLVVGDELRGLIARRRPALELRRIARQRGMTTLHEAGSALVRAGATTAAEVARVIDAAEELAT